MQGKDGSREPGIAEVKTQEQSPEEPRGKQMQEEIFHMVGQCPRAPELVIEPEGAAAERVVLLERRGLCPHAQKPANILHQGRDVCRPRVIVPYEAAIERREVGDEGGDENQEAQREGRST